MKGSQTQVTKQQMECKCGVEFNANIIVGLVNNPIILGGGLCPKCRKELEVERQKHDEALRLAELATRRRVWRESCGITPKFMLSDFANFDKSKINELPYDKCVEYAENFPLNKSCRGFTSLALFSTKVWGVGKTHLVCAIAHRILNRWNGEVDYCPILFTSEYLLFRRIRATYERHYGEEAYHETETDIIRRMTTVPLLIVDDVGKERVADPSFVQRMWFSIIDGRYNNMLPIVLTSNLHPNALAAHFGGDGNDAIFDRLAEMCKGFYEVIGQSYRQSLV